VVPYGSGRIVVCAWLTRRCSRPAAGDAHGLAAQQSAAGLLSGRLVSRTRSKSVVAASFQLVASGVASVGGLAGGPVLVAQYVPAARRAAALAIGIRAVGASSSAGRASTRLCLESGPRALSSAPYRGARRPRATVTGYVGT
jgi:hypothetical protein